MLNNITVTDISSVHTIPTAKGRRLSIIDRPSYALSFCIDNGKITYEHNGQQTVSDRSHAVILPMGASYCLRNDEGGDFPIINFKTVNRFTDKFISIPLSAPERYFDDFDRMQRLFSIGEDHAKLFSVFYSILSRLDRESQKNDPIITGAVEYIANNLSNPNLSNTLLAKESSVSEVYFRKLFKKYYGTTPKQYILNLRINRAKELLSDGLSSVGNVADMCGFSSVYHFSRCFRQVTGHKPSDFHAK